MFKKMKKKSTRALQEAPLWWNLLQVSWPNKVVHEKLNMPTDLSIGDLCSSVSFLYLIFFLSFFRILFIKHVAIYMFNINV